MLVEKALKTVSLSQSDSGAAPQRKVLASMEELAALADSKNPEPPLLLVAGKNTIRSFKYDEEK